MSKRLLFLFAPLVLLALAPLPGGVVSPHQRPALAVIDGDDEGVLPFTSETPIGSASGIVVGNFAILHVAGLTIGPTKIGSIAYPSVADGHNCIWVQVPIAGGGMMTMEQPVPAGTGDTLGEAVQEYKSNLELAGPTAHSCVN